MAPAPELVAGGGALALPGKAYLFRFAWPEGTMGMSRAQVRLAGADLFKVELVDPWQMKIYPLGYTAPGDQAFTPPLAPALLRITAAAPGAGEPRRIGELTAAFAGDLPSAGPADPARFVSGPMHYALDFPLAQIEASPAGKAVLERYVPSRYLRSPMNVLTLEAVAKMAAMSPDQMKAMSAELAKIPVE
jgi:hypothetical protein